MEHRLNKICELIIGFYRTLERFRIEFQAFQKEKKFSFREIDVMEVDLYHLKNKTHAVFRHDADENGGVLERENLFDLIIGSIFHEALHLKEYIYTLQSYEPRYMSFAVKKREKRIDRHQDNFLKYSREIVREAREELPKKAVEVKNLFEDALSLMEEILRKYRTSRRLMRMLYLERELLDKIYGKKGLEHVYRIIYKGGAMEGYFRVGASFLRDGFLDFALKSFDKALSMNRGSRLEKEIKQEIKKKCEFLQKKQPQKVELQRILSRL